MTAQISVIVGGAGPTTVVSGVVADPAGNLWNLPASVNIPSGGKVTVIASADAANPQAVFPGSNVILTIENAQAGWTYSRTAAVVTPPEFRTSFPEFADPAAYPDGQIQYWLNWAYVLLNPCRWGNTLDLAAQLYAAHNLVEERRAILEAAKGGVPGNAIGPASSKTVDKVSVSYDIAVVSEKDGGDWNQTIYGRRLYRMIQMFGMGPIQVGIGWTPPWVFGNGGAWPGPPAWPGAPGWGN